MPIAIDLFCGAGGFSLGLIQAGFKVVAAVDYDVYAAMTYMVNLGSYPINIHFIEPEDKERFESALEEEIKRRKRNSVYIGIISGSGWMRDPRIPKHIPNNIDYTPEPVKNFWLGDIRKLKGEDILDAIGLKPGEIDLIAGGPPCQGFSAAGKREVMDPRNSLVFEFARMILEIQPKMFVMENVPGITDMITPDGLPVLDEFCRILEDGGYAPMNALKKSLLASSGAGAAMKRNSYKKNTESKKAEETKQLSLFGDMT